MKKTYIIIILSLLVSSCKKFVDVGAPQTQLQSDAIFKTDATAHAAQLAIYAAMETDLTGYHLVLYSGLSADELINYSSTTNYIDLAANNLTPENTIIYSLWTNLYKYVYQANNILERIQLSTSLSLSTVRQLEGESKFIRAYCHWYLLQLYGEIPLVKETDFRINSILPRSAIEIAYDFIESDLKDAIMLLPEGFTNGTGSPSTERVRPIKPAALALLSRIHLYRGNWIAAEANASTVIENSLFSLVTDLNLVFLKNSKEAVLQWMGVSARNNTPAGAGLILTTTPTLAALDTQFVKSFSSMDKRKNNWIKSITAAGKTYWYPFKYKLGNNTTPITEYTMVLRLSEQYLIRAEARARQDNLAGALADLNAVRNRAGLSSLSALTQTAIIDSIQSERRYELFTESGDRWFNLRRTGKINQVLAILKGVNWNTTDVLYPIPQTERNRNAY